MTINNELIRELAHRYFSDKMPRKLRTYLYDRYAEEPLVGDLAPEYFLSAVTSDIEKYIHGELDMTLRTDLEKLQDRYQELSDITGRFAEETRRLRAENQYYADFIHWLYQYDKYREFRKLAHEEQDEFGFTYYTL